MKITKIETAVQKIQKLRVAAYCRVSTDFDDQLESLCVQKEHYEEYIRKINGWEFAGIFYDEGISATSTECRNGLHKLLNECRNGHIDRILIKSISRFARNTVDCISIIRELNTLGISVYFEKENIDTGTMDSELILAILSSLAEEESHSTSENLKWSFKKAFMNGTYKQSYAPYGYLIDENHSLKPHPDESKTVTEIFSLFISGYSGHKIAGILNERKIPPRRSSRWNSTTVCSIIKNERYTGDCLYQKTYTDDRFHRHTNNGEVEMYLVENNHEAIISREVFEKANRILLLNAEQKSISQGTDKYLQRHTFSGKITCSCGSHFKRAIINEGSDVVWSCKTHILDKEKCCMKSLKDAALKNAFATMINKLIFSRKILLEPYVIKLRKSSNAEISAQILIIQQRADNISAEKDKLTTLCAQELIDIVFYNQEINRLSKIAAGYKKELRALEEKDSEENYTLREAEKLLKFTESSEMLDEFIPEIFTEFVQHIKVNSRTQISFVLKCGLELMEEII